MLKNAGKTFEYKKLTEAEQKSRGILGRLVGPCADFVNPTRNGRKYSEELWENVFNNSIMQEKIKNRCVFGELGHPVDRTETDMEKIAICLAEQPKKGSDGKLYGVFDILNTPNGRILKSLCDYGCTVGISSRGQGDLITDMDGEEAVDPDTYDCECFDVVLLPGVEAARLKYVTESLDTNHKKGLKLALAEDLKTANDNERKIMEDTLKQLNIKLDEAAEGASKEIWTVTFSDDKNNFSGDVECFDTKDEALNAIKGADNNMKYALLALHKDGDKNGNADESKIYTSNFTVEEAVEEQAPVAEAAPVNEAADEEEVPDETTEEKVEISDEEETPEEDEEEIEIDDEVEIDDADEEDVDERTDEEIFLDFLANNFDEDKVKEACDILGIEVEEDEEPEEEKEESDEEESAEEAQEEKESEEAEEADDDIEVVEEKKNEDEEKALNEGLDAVVNSLKETLKAKVTLENTIKELQEKLAVSDTKVNEINEECEKYKKAVTRLSALAKNREVDAEKIAQLEEALTKKDGVIDVQKARIAKLVNERKESSKSSSLLTEDVNAKKDEIKSLNEQLQKATKENEEKIKALQENLDKNTALKESYKKLANKVVNKYIEIKADILGLEPRDIKCKLGESYTVEDVDKVYDELKRYQLNVSRLPFEVNKSVGIRVNENVNKKAPVNKNNDDEVDDTLIKIANLY